MERPVLVTVKGIGLEQETRLPILLLRSTIDSHLLPIPIGPAEASSIIIEIEGVTPPRPLAHDLITELFRRHRLAARRLEIYGYMQEKHLARIVYGRWPRIRSLEVRPSDGVALALRLGMPIYVAASILEGRAADLAASQNYEVSPSDILFLQGGSGLQVSGQ